MSKFVALSLCFGVGLFGSAILYAANRPAGLEPDAMPEFVAVELANGNTLNVGRYEITIGQWRRCAADGFCLMPDIPARADVEDSLNPMVGINWFDTQAYIGWLKTKTDLNLRLPTHREWLQIASEHSPPPKKKLFQDPRLAWAADYDINAEPVMRTTLRVGGFGSNAHGVFDVRGNVWEWTASECGTPDASEFDTCRSGRIVMGQHVAFLSDFVREPGNASCGAGLPPANLGMRLVY